MKMPRSVRFLRQTCAALLLLSSMLVADEKGGFKQSEFFKAFAGDWSMEGELKGTEGKVIKFKEDWKAEILNDDTLSVEGKRVLDGNEQSYKWTFTHNPTTGLYEASHAFADSGDSIRFEVNLMEAEMKMEMTAIVGSGNSKVSIIDSFPEKDRDSLESKIALVDDTGATTLSGTVTHKRSKKP
jgi:hypothetical protein